MTEGALFFSVLWAVHLHGHGCGLLAGLAGLADAGGRPEVGGKRRRLSEDGILLFLCVAMMHASFPG